MGWLRRMRRVLAWFGTEHGALILILATLAVIIGVVWHSADRAAERQAGETASRIAAALAYDVGRNVEQFGFTLQTATAGRQSPATLSLSPQERNLLLLERVPPDRYIDFVEVLDAEGNVLASAPVRPEANNWARRDYFIAQRATSANEAFIGRPFATQREDRAAIPISRRITNPDGSFAGVVVMGVRLAYFRDLFSRLELGPNDSVTLFRDDGTILMRLPFDLNDLGRTVDANAPFAAFLRNGTPAVTARGANDGIERRFVFRRVGSLPLVVSVGMEVDSSHAWWFAALGVSAVAAVSAMARWLWSESRQRERAERESREKSRFLNTLSHELRTPLHGILGHADQLAADPMLGEAGSRQVGKIVAAAKHMRDVVNVVLDYARVEALGPALHMRRLDVREVVRDCLDIIEPEARRHGLETRFVAAPAAPAQFVADEVQLRQILMNLLSNAVKYTPRGCVEVRLRGDDRLLTIEVADTGIGIPDVQRHRLFHEYERFGTERTTIEGTGLGLAIADRLARRMGGHLGHRNNHGGGSVFWLSLPAGAAVEPVAPLPAEEAPATNLSVLVVDDSEINREVAAAFLRKAGHRVAEAHDGAEAVRLAALSDFDVVLMDMRMAGLDGVQAARQIRNLHGPRGAVPIVAVTANALDEHADECRLAGMTDHLAKPFTQAELIAVVTRVTRRRGSIRAMPVDAIDADSVAQLTACMGRDGYEGLLDCLALRIEALMRRLEEPAALTTPEELADLAHELVGSGGTLGFARLSVAAERFERTIATGSADFGQIRREAEAALVELRRRRSVEAALAG